MPHKMAVGNWRPPLSQVFLSQLAPGRTHVPQLQLQHSSPMLQVFIPHCTLTATLN
jgi:hypothetical protein